LLAAPTKLRPVKHHAAMDWQLVPDFMTKLREQTGIAAKALSFAVLVAGRSGEVRLAVWSEFDLDAAVWVIPAERMKAGKPHRVPLSPSAVELLRDLPRFEGAEYVFPSPRTGRPLSDAALGKVLKDMMIEVTAHGFRSSFRDWAAERTSFQNIVCEQALAHSIGDKVEASYRRGDLFQKRRKLMTAWSTYCTTPTATLGTVVPIRVSS
jgi:integrase